MSERQIRTEDGMPVAYIEPYCAQLLGDALFDTSERPINRDGVLNMYAHLRRRCEDTGIHLHTSDFIPPGESGEEVFLLNTVNSDSILHHSTSTRADVWRGSFYLCEPPTDPCANPRSPYRNLKVIRSSYRRVYTSCTPEAVRALGVPGGMGTSHFLYPNAPDGVMPDLWMRERRKPLVMVNSPHYSPMRGHELLSERLRALRYFGGKWMIDLYGPRWREFPGRFTARSLIRLARRPSSASLDAVRFGIRSVAQLRGIMRVYRGPCESKYRTLSQYDFAVCYENIAISGFVSEKMIDCLCVGTIPVYWGAPDACDWVPSECFIDRRQFRSNRELHRYLLSLGDADRSRLRDAGRDFMGSERFRPFSKDYFAERFICDLREDLALIESGEHPSVKEVIP